MGHVGCSTCRRARRTLTRSIAFKYSEENKVTDNYSMSERLRLAHGSSERERGGRTFDLYTYTDVLIPGKGQLLTELQSKDVCSLRRFHFGIESSLAFDTTGNTR